MDEENLFGLTQAPMKEISFKIIFTVQVSIDGRTVEYIKESGQIIKWKEKVFSLGVMAVATSEAIKMIKNTEMVHSNGPTVASILENGFWENSTVREYISKKEKKDKVFGRWVKE